MDSVNVKFTINEAQVLIQLLDIAVRAQGLNAAEAGVILSRKIQQEFQAAGGDASILDPNAGSDGSAGQGGSGPTGPENTEVSFASFASGPSQPTGPTGPTGPSSSGNAGSGGC